MFQWGVANRAESGQMVRPPFRIYLAVVAAAALCLPCARCAHRAADRHQPGLVRLTAYQSDTLLVRALLDTNGLRSVPVGAVSRTEHERIVAVRFTPDTYPIKRLPGYVAGLSRLYELYVVDCGLRSLPHEIDYLHHLRLLRLDHNRLINLPEEIGDLGNLEELSVSHNQLVEAPDMLHRLSRLRVLDLSHNRIRRLTDSLGTLRRLEALDLSFNSLSRLPESIGKLDSLLTLKLDYNSLVRLPESIAELTRLRILTASNNRLDQLPYGLLSVPHLNVLQLSFNRIETLPVPGNAMSELMILDLRSNELGRLPDALGHESCMPALYELHLEENRLCSLPASVAGRLQRMGAFWRGSQRCGVIRGDTIRHVLVPLGDTVDIGNHRLGFLGYTGPDDNRLLLIRTDERVGLYRDGQHVGGDALGIRIERVEEHGRRLKIVLSVPSGVLFEPPESGCYELVGTDDRLSTHELGPVRLVAAGGDSVTLGFADGGQSTVRAGDTVVVTAGRVRARVACRWVLPDCKRGPLPHHPDSIGAFCAAGIAIVALDTGPVRSARVRESIIAADADAMVYVYDLSGRLLASAPYRRSDDLLASMPNGSYVRKAEGGGEVVWDRFMVNR